MGNSASRESASSGSSCPVMESPASPPASQSSCPVPESARSRAVYNVYNQRIDGASQAAAGVPQPALLDPRNNMPLEPNQRPVPGQRQLLSTDRQASTIPKGGTEGTWLYPSPQMFFNALRRKEKGDDVVEDDMASVIFAHNSMNEQTWQHVLRWESLHQDTCCEPRLTRFRGRPDDLSPLARLKSWTGGPLPFDRHDWYVDRCGEEVRYVIDFYFDDDKAGTPEAFGLTVRPALDSPGAALDRTKMFIYTQFAKHGLPCPVTGHPSTVGAQEAGEQQQV